MAAGRAQVTMIGGTRQAIHAALSRPDAPMPDGSTVARTIRLVGVYPGDAKGLPLSAEAVYSRFARRPNKGDDDVVAGDPRAVVDPPIWSYESPEFMSLRKAVSWDHVDALDVGHLVDEVRVQCVVKGHAGLGDDYVQRIKGRLWTSGSLTLRSAGLVGGEAIAIGVGPSDGPAVWEDLVGMAPPEEARKKGSAAQKAWRAEAKRRIGVKCPEHPTAMVDVYPVLHSFARSCAFFSNTSKMSTLSWSLPAGPPAYGGTCPGAAAMAGMAMRKPKSWSSAAKAVEAATGENPGDHQWLESATVVGPDRKRHAVKPKRAGKAAPPEARLWSLRDLVADGRAVEPPGGAVGLSKGLSTEFVCDICYALKGNYANVTTQINATIRLFWLEYSLGRRWDPRSTEGGFKTGVTPQRVEATARMISDGIGAAMENTRERRLHGHSLRHFRVHDSADFMTEDMVDVWGLVCEARPEILFWFPTRVWHLPGYVKRLRAWTSRLPNMTVRPSSFFVNRPAPSQAQTGLAAGSTAGLLPEGSEPHWPCPAYLAREATCANAINPWGWRYLLDRYGMDHVAMMVRRALTDDERKVMAGGEVPQSWLTSAPVFPKAQKPGKRTPVWEEILEKEFPEGIGCRVCWGGRNVGPGQASNMEDSPLGPLRAVPVVYHEH